MLRPSMCLISRAAPLSCHVVAKQLSTSIKMRNADSLSVVNCFAFAAQRMADGRNRWCSSDASQQSIARLPLGACVELLEQLHVARRQYRDRQTVAIQHTISGQRRKLGPGRDDAHQIERIGTGNRDPRAVAWLAPDLAQHADRFRQGKLLASEAGHETAAADVAAALQWAEDTEQIAPGRQPGGFALEQAPEHDAVTA